MKQLKMENLNHSELAALNRSFGRDEALRFETGKGGLTRAVLTSPSARCEVYLHGAHVAAFETTGGKEPLLFLARDATFAPDRAIRGGVPICFPWFGAKRDDPDAPSHGLARKRPWAVVGSDRTAGGGVSLTLGHGFGPLLAHYVVTVDACLHLALEVENRTDGAETFEQVLHSYLAVGDVRQATLEGLAGSDYLDQLDGLARKTEGDEPIRFTAETDRVYLATRSRKIVRDPVLGRSIIIEAENAATTVVWNPWTEKTARMGDLADDEWPRMLCVETGNVKDDAVTLEPDGRHRMTTTIQVESLEQP